MLRSSIHFGVLILHATSLSYPIFNPAAWSHVHFYLAQLAQIKQYTLHIGYWCCSSNTRNSDSLGEFASSIYSSGQCPKAIEPAGTFSHCDMILIFETSKTKASTPETIHQNFHQSNAKHLMFGIDTSNYSSLLVVSETNLRLALTIFLTSPRR